MELKQIKKTEAKKTERKFKCRFRPATKQDATILGMKLRDEDKQELIAIHGFGVDFTKLIEMAIERATEAHVAESLDGELILIFGVSVYDAEKNYGTPWLLGSDKAPTLKRELVFFGRICTEAWLTKFKALINFVDKRNLVAISWLKRIGFHIHKPFPFGELQRQFHMFTMQ